jgi:hypothetical protein
MTPERFQQIEELYHAAREGTAEERAALLARIDPELRREIESLLAQRTGGEFLDRPAMQNAPELLEIRLSPYWPPALAWGHTVSKANSVQAAWAKSFGR